MFHSSVKDSFTGLEMGSVLDDGLGSVLLVMVIVLCPAIS